MNRTGYKLSGYIVQHTWIAFFLWMSAMSINITHCFNDIFHRHKQQDSKHTRALLLNILFDKACLITVITLSPDETDGEYPEVHHPAPAQEYCQPVHHHGRSFGL